MHSGHHYDRMPPGYLKTWVR